MDEFFLLSCVVVGLLLAFIAGGVASSRGLSFGAYFLVGLLLPVLGIVLAMVMQPPLKPVADAALYGLVKQRASAEAARAHAAWLEEVRQRRVQVSKDGQVWGVLSGYEILHHLDKESLCLIDYWLDETENAWKHLRELPGVLG